MKKKTDNTTSVYAASPRLSAVLARLDNLSAIPAADLANHPRKVPLAVLDSNVVFDVWYWNDKDAQVLKTAILEKRLQLVSTPSCLKEFAVVPHCSGCGKPACSRQAPAGCLSRTGSLKS